MSSWVSFPKQWKLEDIQAGLNVLITALSGLVIFVFVRLSWQSGARRIAQTKAVSLPSLFTLNTPGEVLDAAGVLKHKLLDHPNILTQCVVVALFSITTLVSGPIARYTTRTASISTELAVNGYLTTRSHNSNGDDQVMWNLTMTSLDRAGFPVDEMLDYLPDPSIHWLYRQEEWNNSWSFTCQSIDATPISLRMSDNCSDYMSKVQGLDSVIPSLQYSEAYSYSRGGYYVNSTLWRDMLMFFHAVNYTAYEEETDIYHHVSMSLAALHLHNIPLNGTDFSGPCELDVGPVESAVFTRIDCDIDHQPVDHHKIGNIAYPDTGDFASISSAFVQYYNSRFGYESISNQPTTIITPRDLRRFFQTYIVTKDVQNRLPVERNLMVSVLVVQISTAFLVIYCLIAFIAIFGGFQYALFLLLNRKILPLLPQSKLDWIVQAAANATPSGFAQSGGLSWVVTTSSPHVDVSQARPEQRKQVLFEIAWYSPWRPQPLPQQIFGLQKASPNSDVTPASQLSPVSTVPVPASPGMRAPGLQ
ncbi:uncharacterized protein A1O9_01492 [Exophiala aquamarina CBS 119918]|uniref:Uncharacterized protein n=1 Tax=Exophiala aquamarina CBS 119918 TaxID=1182545 RepID=A0A072PTT1_9EURO|nr:uncharacterized protein A1O9_01492 [Exophiala aquamarina CBS 119918]KEF63514.1 hypothetical protein A1O9_01492 [Exophiala aquamarina CBS 119918]